MTLVDSIELYSAVIATLAIVAATFRYIMSSKIHPIEKEIDLLQRENKEREEELGSVKKALVDDVKEISQGNFEFRLKYEGAIKDLRLLLAERYTSKEQLDKEINELKRRIDIQSDIKAIITNLKDGK